MHSIHLPSNTHQNRPGEPGRNRNTEKENLSNPTQDQL